MTKNPAFEVGAVVELKTGSAKLCVRSVDGDQVTVDWFEGETANTKTFSAAQLQLSLSEMSDTRLARLSRAAGKLLSLDEFKDRNLDTLIEHALDHRRKTES